MAMAQAAQSLHASPSPEGHLSIRSSPAGVTGKLKLAKPGRVFPAAERENGIKSIQIRAGSREKTLKTHPKKRNSQSYC